MIFNKTTNRWFIVAGSLVIQLCLGSLYAWSIFVNPLKHQYGYTTTQTQSIFSLSLASYAISMIFAGRLQDQIGPRKTALIGSVLFASGYILCSYTGGSYTGILVTIGIIAGSGIGFCYVCPISALIKWFPDMRGFITGLGVAGFGAGAGLFVKLVYYFIDSAGVMRAFLYLGIIFLVSCIPSSFLLSNPPDGWVPAGWLPEKKQSLKLSREFSWREMTATYSFWLLWMMFIAGAGAGLLVIGNLKPFGLSNGISAAAAGSAVGILAIFNGFGRIAWGTISDKIGRTNAMCFMFAFQAIMMFSLAAMGYKPLHLSIAASCIGFNFGGIFALFPAATADFFGTKNLGINYAFVFSAYGIAGIIGPILGGKMFDLTGSYLYAFIPAGVMCIFASISALITKHPVYQSS